MSKNKKFVLEFNSVEDLRFSFKPKTNDVGNISKIELEFNPEGPAATIIARAYPLFLQTPEEMREQKKWIVWLIYDLLQQFGLDVEYSCHEKILNDSNANLTRNALSQLFRTRRSLSQTDIPQWCKDMKKLIPFIRARM